MPGRPPPQSSVLNMTRNAISPSRANLALDISIAGRHRLDWAHGWHHLGAWEAVSPEAIDQAITGHEDVADFIFTTSRHFMGRVRPLHELIAA